MKSLLIHDLSATTELGAAEMSAVHGGTGYGMPVLPSWPMPGYGRGGDVNFNAAQMLSQSQATEVNNGNNVAFASGICANVNPTQNGTNTINFG